MRVLLITYFLLIGLLAVGQGFNDKQVQLIDGKTYYLHKVEKGNTLYSISKMYSVPIKDLINENPSLEEGLKLDQVIRIPVKKVSKKVSGENAPVAVGEYLVHTVEPKETLYGLSRKYQVGVDEIKALNPELSEGLKIGLELKIPLPKEEEVKNPMALAPAQPDSFLFHLVEPKETFYSLAKEYDVNLDSLRILNEGLGEGLKVGTTIRIPIKKEKEKKEMMKAVAADIIELPKDTSEIKDSYTICLMLPLYLDINDSIASKKLDFEKDELYSKSQIAIDFYAGIRLAVDSLTKLGHKYELKVFDTRYDPSTRNTNVVVEYLKDPELVNVDLFIGPFYRANFEIVAEYANKLKVPIITPVPQSINILRNNPYVIKAFSSPESQAGAIRNYVAKNRKGDNLILVESNHLKDVLLTEKFKGIEQGDTNRLIHDMVNNTFKSLKIFEFDTARFNYMLSDSLHNTLVVPAQNKTFVARLLNILNKSTRDYQITVFGMDKWNSFGYIDYRYLNNLRVHTPRNNWVNFEDPETEKVVKRFRERYFNEPSEWSWLGYDLSFFMLSSLHQNGTAFYENWSNKSSYSDGYSRRFHFQRIGPNSGFENKGSRIVKMENYYEIVVNP